MPPQHARRADDVSEVPQAGAQSRYAAEWGLASVLLANVLIMAGIGALLLILFYVSSMHNFRPDRSDVRVAGITMLVVVGCFCLLALVSVIFGSVGVRAAWRRCQPGGLPVTGLLLSLGAVVLWAAVVLALVKTLEDLSLRGHF
jgi:hypothetical protein